MLFNSSGIVYSSLRLKKELTAGWASLKGKLINVLSQVARLVMMFTQVYVILDLVINVAVKISRLYIHHKKLC